ncbi:MAG TPA: TauD/TfdA family dioxygenase [Pseudonocardiaceae bacterium]|jgi:alpha-ketoglutarate-dependent taurine dioxygenase|nr:TauD/TfdA family dioxygenase [Pseudonocardiaceae bacterium]
MNVTDSPVLVDADDDLDAALRRDGAVVVRGFDVADAADVGRVARSLAGRLMTEREGFAPRETYEADVYSSSKWPANQPMCMHHELSYATESPSLLVFGCLTAPAAGGDTAVADGQAVLRALPAELVTRFERDGWQLVRNYNDSVGVGWAEAFGSNDRHEVERYCAANAIDVEWRQDNGLRTSQVRPAVVTHPVSGERCWFNQIAFLNELTIDPEVREYLTLVFGPDGLPFTTHYGNGDPVEADVVDLINTVYQEHTRSRPWQVGDVLLVDNIRTAHSREPFEGAREIVVAMGDPLRPADLVVAR